MLVDDWKDWWRWWSLRLTAAGTTVTGYLIANPDAAINAWNQLPDSIKESITPEYMPFVGIAIVVSGMFARLLAQNNLKHEHVFIISEKRPTDAHEGDFIFVPSKLIVAQLKGGKWVQKPARKIDL